MATQFYVVKRGKEYWVTGGGEKSVYSVKKAGARWNIIREWWPINDDDVPIQTEVVSSHETRLGAAQRMGRMLKPLTLGG